jgi:hypothetical protein
VSIGRIPQTMPLGGGGYGDTSQLWDWLAAFFADGTAGDPTRAALAAFVARVATSPFARAGLCGMQSHYDLWVGLSGHLFDNPHLIITFDIKAQEFRFEYADGSDKRWTRTAGVDDAYAVFERFLMKRARWFRSAHPVPSPRPPAR